LHEHVCADQSDYNYGKQFPGVTLGFCDWVVNIPVIHSKRNGKSKKEEKPQNSKDCNADA